MAKARRLPFEADSAEFLARCAQALQALVLPEPGGRTVPAGPQWAGGEDKLALQAGPAAVYNPGGTQWETRVPVWTGYRQIEAAGLTQAEPVRQLEVETPETAGLTAAELSRIFERDARRYG